MKEVRDIVAEYLKKHKFDGLYNISGVCACKLDDLIPCEGAQGECTVGYKVPCDCGGGCGWHIKSEPLIFRDKKSGKVSHNFIQISNPQR